MTLLADDEHLRIRLHDTHLEFQLERWGRDSCDRRFESIEVPIPTLLSVAVAGRMPEALQSLIEELSRRAKPDLL